MRITNVEYDSKRGVINVEVELPVIGELTIEDAKLFLYSLVDQILPKEVKER